MNNCKRTFFLILTIGINLFACQNDPFAVKKRVNPNDENFKPADISIISLSRDDYLSLDSPVIIEWKKLTPKLTMINPAIWLYRNGKEYGIITEIDENEVQGKKTIDIVNITIKISSLMDIDLSLKISRFVLPLS